jgi:hypothetical protein
MFVFEHVFFHDTDTIYLTAQAAGFQVLKFEGAGFTTSDMEANMSLNPVP